MLEDICADIGFGATIRLCAVHGGRSLYVPGEVDLTHPLALLLGEKPFARFVAGYGPQSMLVPRIEEFEQWRRVRLVSELLSKSMTVSDIARSLCMTDRQVRNYRSQAESIGLVPLVNSAARAAGSGSTGEMFETLGGPDSVTSTRER